MNAAQLDASRRIADVKKMIAYQTTVKSELKSKRLPVERVENLIDILGCCLLVIEASQRAGDEEPSALPAPSVPSSKAA
jgi:hypothetical protein